MNIDLGMDVPQRIETLKAVEEIDTVNEIPHFKEKEEEQTKLGGYPEFTMMKKHD